MQEHSPAATSHRPTPKHALILSRQHHLTCMLLCRRSGGGSSQGLGPAAACCCHPATATRGCCCPVTPSPCCSWQPTHFAAMPLTPVTLSLHQTHSQQRSVNGQYVVEEGLACGGLQQQNNNDSHHSYAAVPRLSALGPAPRPRLNRRRQRAPVTVVCR
jgi:hypothetical protein